jgi:lysozyme
MGCEVFQLLQMEHITCLDAAGIAFIKQFEGYDNKPYLDSAGVPTIGYGSTYYEDGKRVTMNDSAITRERADAIYAHNVKHYELSVDAMTRDDINQHQFNALVSFAYNEGVQKLKGSTLLKKVNANPNDDTIIHEFERWVYADGKVLNGLVARRKAEADMYFNLLS